MRNYQKRRKSEVLREKLNQKQNQPSYKVDLVIKQRNRNTSAIPYSLSDLQIDAAKRFGMSAQLVLDICQQLYEPHKLMTYPRSDCRYLPKEHLNDVKQVVGAIGKSCSALSDTAKNANLSLKSKAWNDSKVSAHHAIIPHQNQMI